MQQLRAGQDEIRFEEESREAAEVVARLLPQVRPRGQETAGVTVRPLRVIVTAAPPPVQEYYPVRWLRLLPGLAVGALGLALPQALPRGFPVLFLCLGGLSALLLGLLLLTQRRLARRVQALWPSAGGFSLEYNRRLPPVLIIHWPRPAPPPALLSLTFALVGLEAGLTQVLAHEYARLLLHARYRRTALPAWWYEGFSLWFAEQVLGQPYWRPESREQRSAPEPSGDVRHLFGQDAYLHLCARYYWEARTVIEQGRLPEILRAQADQLNSFRPTFETSPEAKPRA